MHLNKLGKYLLYLRKSRADFDLENSGAVTDVLKRHEERLLEIARNLGITISDTYREVVSGETIASRPYMQRLLSEVEQGMWDGVLVVEVERLARGDTIDQGIVSQAFKYSNTLIITPSKIYDPNNEFDEEYFEFGLFMSRREYKTINRRLQAGRIASVREGKFVGNKPPYGYERVKLEGQKGYTLKPIPEQASIVNMIFNWYVYGKDNQDFGASKIVRKLNEMKIPTINGGDWTPSTIHGILENPVYIGKIRWNSRKQVKKSENGQIKKTRPRATDYIVSDGLHEAIISEDLYELAQKRREKNPPRPVSVNGSMKNPLSGLLVCSKCGRKMVRKPYAIQNKIDSILCPYTTCDNISSPLYQVEHEVIRSMQKIIAEYKINKECVDNSSIKSDWEQNKALLKTLKTEYHTVESQKEKLFDFLERGIYSDNDFVERRNILDKKLSDLKISIEEMERDLKETSDREDAIEEILPRFEHLVSNYDNMDAAEKNEILKQLISKIEYTKTTRNTKKNATQPLFTLEIYTKLF